MHCHARSDRPIAFSHPHRRCLHLQRCAPALLRLLAQAQLLPQPFQSYRSPPRRAIAKQTRTACNKKATAISDGLDVTMEPATGLEPATGSLQNCYATIASCRHTKMRVGTLYDNNPDSQSLSHKRYNHHRQDIAGHVTRPHVRKRGRKNLPSIGPCTFH